jgi:hypothetical protein
MRDKTHTASVMLLVGLVQTLGKRVLHLAIPCEYLGRSVSIVQQMLNSKQFNWGQIPINSLFNYSGI